MVADRDYSGWVKKPVDALKGYWRGFLYGSNKPDPRAKFIWPESVGFKLKNCDAQLDKSDVRTLASSGFDEAAFYLTMKSLGQEPDIQSRVLSKVSQSFNEASGKSFREAILFGIDAIPEGLVVDGGKLTDISPIGIEALNTKFAVIAGNVTAEDKTPVLLAYGSLLGYQPFAEVCAKNGTDLYIVKVSNSETSEVAGFRIMSSGDVELLKPDFQRAPRTVLVDDILNTGKSFEDVGRFWRIGADSGVTVENAWGFKTHLRSAS